MAETALFTPRMEPSSPAPKAIRRPGRRPQRQSGLVAKSGSRHQAGLLAETIAALHTAMWEAWADPLEIISLEFGVAEHPFFGVEAKTRGKGMRWLDYVHPLDRPHFESFLASQGRGAGRRSHEYRLVLANGELLWVRHCILRRQEEDNGRVRLSGLVTVITEEKRLEWECLRVSERECCRIGQEMHDDLCQILAGLSCLLRVLGRRAVKAVPDLKGEFDLLNAEVVGVIQRTRSMAHGLFPARVRHGTLRQALQELVRQIETRFGLQLQLDMPKQVGRHGPDQIMHLYRIVQEAVSNAMRHGRATHVTITVRASRHRRMVLQIEDNGSGFPKGSGRAEGIGLEVMKYRARVLGGTLTFGNRGIGGGSVLLQYPIEPRSAVSNGSGSGGEREGASAETMAAAG